MVGRTLLAVSINLRRHPIPASEHLIQPEVQECPHTVLVSIHLHKFAMNFIQLNGLQCIHPMGLIRLVGMHPGMHTGMMPHAPHMQSAGPPEMKPEELQYREMLMNREREIDNHLQVLEKELAATKKRKKQLMNRQKSVRKLVWYDMCMLVGFCSLS